MKKFALLAAATALVLALTGCGSLRTPGDPATSKIWYNTFFGISIESAVNGDGIIVSPK